MPVSKIALSDQWPPMIVYSLCRHLIFQNFLDGGVGNLVGLAGGARAPAANQNEANNEVPPQDGDEEGEEGEENGNNAAQGSKLFNLSLAQVNFLGS